MREEVFRVPAAFLFAVCLLFRFPACADSTWVYAVEVTATVQTSPPAVTLSWLQDDFGANSYTVYRKTKDATSWGAGVGLPGTATHYVDSTVPVGAAFEYQIVKDSVPGYTGYGYIYAGIDVPLVDDRGKIILIVASTHVAALASELARLESDLIGDGWTVIRHDVASSATPDSVRNLIISDYNADPANVNAVFLFGRIPVFRSGNLNYDTHGSRPMPADAFYGDVDGNWSGNPNFLPSDVELMVGRVDLSGMPGTGATVPWPDEAELLRNYLNKNHAWRHKQIDVPRRALMGDRRGEEQGEATAASGFRNFAPLVGPENVILANVEDVSAPEERWGPMLGAERYLWAYGNGAGQPSGISHLGTRAPYNELWSTDVVGQDEKAVFVMLFGSWFGDWDGDDNFMRAFLATPTMGLACFMAGRPHWFVHHMGLGEPIGYSTRLTMNNDTLYRNDENRLPRAIYIALMGDPTLRTDPVGPAAALSAVAGAGGVVLNWAPPSDAVAGYHVYRSQAGGPYARVTDVLLTGTEYLDADVADADYSYMVRAVKRQITPSGTYFNASQGIFATVTARSPALPIAVKAEKTASGVTLEWNSRAGIAYRVLGCTELEGDWTDLSGTIMGNELSTSWMDSGVDAAGHRFYRVVSP